MSRHTQTSTATSSPDAPQLTTYVIRRRGGWPTPEALQETGKKSASVADDEMSDDIRWLRSYVVAESDGTVGTLCIYQASSPEKIQEHASRVGMPADEIVEVADTVIVRPDPQPATV